MAIKTIKKVLPKEKRIAYSEYAREGITKGFFWAIGVTLGFAFISTIVVFILGRFVDYPIIGSFVANVVEETNNSLSRRQQLNN